MLQAVSISFVYSILGVGISVGIRIDDRINCIFSSEEEEQKKTNRSAEHYCLHCGTVTIRITLGTTFA
jgi:hypothetical protein